MSENNPWEFPQNEHEEGEYPARYSEERFSLNSPLQKKAFLLALIMAAVPLTAWILKWGFGQTIFWYGTAFFAYVFIGWIIFFVALYHKFSPQVRRTMHIVSIIAVTAIAILYQLPFLLAETGGSALGGILMFFLVSLISAPVAGGAFYAIVGGLSLRFFLDHPAKQTAGYFLLTATAILPFFILFFGRATVDLMVDFMTILSAYL